MQLLGLYMIVKAQFPPTPAGQTVLKSRFNENITISFKEPGLCETTPGVRSYAGYIHLPPGTLDDSDQQQNYSINTFFWFFEARKDPQNAPLSIWLNGGPGSSSMLGLLTENGPCYVNSDSNSTRLNPNSWNNEVNMLYIDQPVQAGFSYDSLKNYTQDLITGETQEILPGATVPEQNTTFLVGTYPSRNSNTTSQGSRNAAVAIWHFAQIWFQEFPYYQPNDARVSISSQSYGGRYGPAFAAFFEEQNDKILNGTETDPGGQYILHLDTLLLVNACIDRQVQFPSYAHMAFNNTYGIQTVNESVYNGMNDAYFREGGCRDQINNCRAVSSVYDPENTGINSTVNKICSGAETFCTENIRDPYIDFSGRNYYDITQIEPDPFPYSFYLGWLNEAHVQAALGVPLNFTSVSSAVADAFRGIGDYPRPGWLEDLTDLLERGVKVTLVYGDRDFACNWIGGEAVSLAINYSSTAQFHAAGYEPVQVNSTYEGGLVRQYGNLSFTRVFQAGHEVPSWQPETALAIFNRALGNRDIATGTKDTTAADAEYSSSGPPDTWTTKSDIPEQEIMFCYLWAGTCTDEQIASITNGTARVVRYVLEDTNSTKLFPELFD
ncbi:hypothetical protein N0V82_007645 [Gnomoniopsis sp. IMI 355080]|nr:hypothetical protein N0V82_007645 [Gnomoniopsis sp. IMI 355080]